MHRGSRPGVRQENDAPKPRPSPGVSPFSRAESTPGSIRRNGPRRVPRDGNRLGQHPLHFVPIATRQGRRSIREVAASVRMGAIGGRTLGGSGQLRRPGPSTPTTSAAPSPRSDLRAQEVGGTEASFLRASLGSLSVSSNMVRISVPERRIFLEVGLDGLLVVLLHDQGLDLVLDLVEPERAGLAPGVNADDVERSPGPRGSC